MTRDAFDQPSANLELVRSIFVAWEGGDFSSAEWAHPKIEFVIADGPTAGSWTGVAGMAESFRGFVSVWEDFRLNVDEFRPLDRERVLVLTRTSGRGKTSGLELGQLVTQGAQLFHVSGDRVTRFVQYHDRDRALADLAAEARSP